MKRKYILIKKGFIMPAKKTIKKQKCGLVMPMSDMEGYNPGHWDEVKNILNEALGSHYDVSIVSETDDAGIIHNNIVKGLYTSDIIVCDISGRNANVMFELGMRLAFDKPFVIIYDGCQPPFDTACIEYIQYPKDLNYFEIKSFKENLLKKVDSTLNKSTENKDYSILTEFGRFEVFKLPEQSKGNEVSNAFNAIMNEVLTVKDMIRQQDMRMSERRVLSRGYDSPDVVRMHIKRLLDRSDAFKELVNLGKIPEAITYFKHRTGINAPEGFIANTLLEFSNRKI